MLPEPRNDVNTKRIVLDLQSNSAQHTIKTVKMKTEHRQLLLLKLVKNKNFVKHVSLTTFIS